MSTHVPQGPGDARTGGPSQAHRQPTTATLRAADVRRDSVTWLHCEVRGTLRFLVPPSLVCLAVLGVLAAAWPHFGFLVRFLLFSVAWCSGYFALCMLSVYRPLRRMERLAMAVLPMTSMVMRVHHQVGHRDNYRGGRVVVHYYWADLWHPQDVECRPSRSASELPIQTEEPVPFTRREPALQVPVHNDGGGPAGVDIPVEVLGTLEDRQWVLILTATEVLWPRKRARTGSLRTRRRSGIPAPPKYKVKCPTCSAALVSSAGNIRCPKCGATMKVRPLA